MNKLFFLLLLLLASCHKIKDDPSMVCIQIQDPNGLNETIAQEEKLSYYNQVDFLQPQPYRQVIRVYPKNQEGKTPSYLTSYHPNGQIWKYLEALDGRSHGKYREWFATGQIKIEAEVSGGTASLDPFAQKDWTFEGDGKVWDAQGNLIAKIPYKKGLLEGTAYYYYPNGKIQKQISYLLGNKEGEMVELREDGSLIQKIFYEKDLPHHTAVGYFQEKVPAFIETYFQGKLDTAIYYDSQGKIIAQIKKGEGFKAIFEKEHLIELQQYQEGIQQGKIQHFSPSGSLLYEYFKKNGKKQGEETEYYLPHELSSPDRELLQPKISLSWEQDLLQGTIKTWYPNGKLESQKELYLNKKNGPSCAWYIEGDLMYLEEYENDGLLQGSYYKKGQKEPVSRIEKGEGLATLFDGRTGHILKKVKYLHGMPEP